MVDRHTAISLSVTTGLSDMLRLDSPAARELSSRRVHAFAEAVVADFLQRTGQYLTDDASREAAIADAVAAERAAIVPALPLRSPECWCETCDEAANAGCRSRLSLCPTCGNKRCPRATHHDHACTDSNDPGQEGSSWENVQPAARARGRA